jgi:hypothetical protein
MTVPSADDLILKTCEAKKYVLLGIPEDIE